MHATKNRTVRQKPTRASKQSNGRQLPKSERAYRELYRRIVDNELMAETLHTEQKLAVQLRLDLASVREALGKLAAEGLVEIRPGKGVRILPISADDMRDIFDITIALEPMAARDAAMQNLRKADVERLTAAVQQMDTALLKNDLLAWARADQLFHTRLIDLCANKRLVAVLAKCLDQRHRARMQTLGARPMPVDSNRDHAAVVDAVRRHDADAAYSLHHDHLARSSHMLISLLRSASAGRH